LDACSGVLVNLKSRAPAGDWLATEEMSTEGLPWTQTNRSPRGLDLPGFVGRWRVSLKRGLLFCGLPEI